VQIQVLAAHSPPQGQNFQVEIESVRRTAFHAGRPRVLRRAAEGDQVRHVVIDGKPVRATAPSQPAPACPGLKAWLEQTPDRADVLVDGVERTARRVLPPEEVDDVIVGDELIGSYQQG
jgi:hypothetical protein